MKKIFCLSFLSLLLSFNLSFSQNYLALSVIPMDFPQEFPDNAKVQIINKLNQILTTNGIASTSANNQFFISVFASPSNKDVLAGPPITISQTLDFTFYIADIENQTILSSTSLSAIGVGNTEAKSYADAIKRLNIKSKQIIDFVNEGKTKIIAYYDAKAETIFAKARALANLQKFEEALSLLCYIPEECSKYEESLTLGSKIFDEALELACQENLLKAKTIWAAEQNSVGAQKAGEYLSAIYPNAECRKDAEALYKEIKAKVLDDWKFELKQYQDGVDIEIQKIKAWKAIGIAFGEGQQPQTTNITWLR